VYGFWIYAGISECFLSSSRGKMKYRAIRSIWRAKLTAAGWRALLSFPTPSFTSLLPISKPARCSLY
jgi:hypothetical protein